MRSVGEFIAEWFREWWCLMGCAFFTFLGIYVAAANKSNAWVVGSSVVAGTVLFFVAFYRAWMRQNVAKTKAEVDLKKFINALKGPEVWLYFQTPDVGFTVENRSKDVDAFKVFFDPIETNSYRLETRSLPELRFGTTQALKAKMIRKSDGAEFLNVDLVDLLNDTCVNFRCALSLTLKYSDSRGHRSVRRVTVSANQVALKTQISPEIVNHEIEPDRDATEGI
jgi:hypothetical protein